MPRKNSIDIIDLDGSAEKRKPKKNKKNQNKNTDSKSGPARKEKEKKGKKKRSRNREFAVITYAFLVLFLALTGYFVYFVGFKAEDFINSPYNPRLSQLSATTIRGEIIASDGTVLATSSVDENDNETRSYPKGNEYAHLVGFATNGMSGVELENNFNLLRSHSFFLKKLANELQDNKNQGDSVVLSVVPALQDVIYNGMDYDGAAIAIDPTTGQILALVSKPDFDPNTISQNWEAYTSDDESSVLVNRATQGEYPPGSTFKIITALEYLREGGSMDDSFDCDGTYTMDNTTIHCFNNRAHGYQTLTDAFANSCNTTFSQLGLSNDLSKTMKLSDKLLFNKKLPTQLKNVKKSSYTLVSDDDTAMVMRTAIGQGNTLVSPIHMAMIVSAIANDGVLMEPFAVDKVINDDGTTIKTMKPETYGNMFSTDEVDKLTTLMRAVVTDGTATDLNSEAYTAYGKTGTAEYADNSDKAHSWFVGFAENGDKKIVVAVVMEGVTGKGTAVPLTKTIFDTYFQ